MVCMVCTVCPVCYQGGVIWPHIAEISLLGAVGCGRWLMETVIEELEISGSQYDYVTLQATDNSIGFYESLGYASPLEPRYCTCCIHLSLCMTWFQFPGSGCILQYYA